MAQDVEQLAATVVGSATNHRPVYVGFPGDVRLLKRYRTTNRDKQERMQAVFAPHLELPALSAAK